LETKSGFGFLQHAVPISRGVRYAVVDVEVSFLYRVEVLPDKYPDVRTVVSDTLAFLQNYPKKKVYWEIYARKAASKLFKDYGVFSSLTVTLVIHPDDLRAYLRTATATVRAASSSISASRGARYRLAGEHHPLRSGGASESARRKDRGRRRASRRDNLFS
jgi:hypothetical protein